MLSRLNRWFGLVLVGFLFTDAPLYGQEGVPLTVQFSAATYSANLSAGQIPVTITLTGIPAGDVTVNYARAANPGTATPDVDYVATTAQGTVTFVKANNDTSKTFNVTLFKNDLPGPNLTINLQLYGVTGGAALGTPSTTTLTIVNDNTGPGPEIVSITATVPSTPPFTKRKADGTVAGAGDTVDNNWPAPAVLTFTTTTNITEAGGKLNFPADMFNYTPDPPDAKAIVLFQDSLSINISVATVNLGGRKVAFDIRRAPDDAAAIGGVGALPTIAPVNTTTAMLNTDNKGSFQFVAFFDKNGNGTWDSTEKGMMLPYILVRAEATLAGDRSVANAGKLVSSFSPNNNNPFDFLAQAGVWDMGVGNAGVSLDADVILIGGGADGRRGLDRVFWGWCQEVMSTNVLGAYPANGAGGTARNWDYLQVSNGANAARPKQLPYNVPIFRAGDAVLPVPAGGMPFPLIDTARKPTGQLRDGGIDVVLSKSPADGRGVVTPAVAPAVGEKRAITAFDSPSAAAPISSSLPGALTLDTFAFNYEFSANLVGWTNSIGSEKPTPGMANSVGWRSFSFTRSNSWIIDSNWKLTPPGANWVANDPAKTISIDISCNDSAVAAAGVLEVRTPTLPDSNAIYEH